MEVATLEPVTFPKEVKLTIWELAASNLVAAWESLPAPFEPPRRRHFELLWSEEEDDERQFSQQFVIPVSEAEIAPVRRACAALVAVRLVCKEAKAAFDKRLVSLISKNADAACVFLTVWERAAAHGLFGRSADSAMWLINLAIEAHKGMPIPYPIDGLLRSMAAEQAVPLLHHLCTLDARAVLGFQKPFALRRLVAVVRTVPAVAGNSAVSAEAGSVGNEPGQQRPNLRELAKLALWAIPVRRVGACFTGLPLTDAMDMDMLVAFGPHCSRLCSTTFGRMLETGSAHNIADFVSGGSPVGLDFLDGTRNIRFTTKSLRDNIAVQRWIGSEPFWPDRARFLRVTDPDAHEWPKLLRDFVGVRAAGWSTLFDEMRFAARHLQGPEDLNAYVDGSHLAPVLKSACDRDPDGLKNELKWRLDMWDVCMSFLVKFLGYLPREHQQRLLEWIEAEIARLNEGIDTDPGSGFDRKQRGLLLRLKEMLERRGDFGGAASSHENRDSRESNEYLIGSDLFDAEPGEEFWSGSDADSVAADESEQQNSEF